MTPQTGVLFIDNTGDYPVYEYRNTNERIPTNTDGVTLEAILKYNIFGPITHSLFSENELDIRDKKFMSTMKNTYTAIGVAFTGPAAATQAGIVGIGARSALVNGADDLSSEITTNGQTIIQNAVGEETGNKIKVGLNVTAIAGGLTSATRNGKSAINSVDKTEKAKSATNAVIDVTSTGVEGVGAYQNAINKSDK